MLKIGLKQQENIIVQRNKQHCSSKQTSNTRCSHTQYWIAAQRNVIAGPNNNIAAPNKQYC